MDISSLSISIPTVIAVVGCFIGVMNFLGNRRKANKDEEGRLVRIETMLVNIEHNTSNLNTRVNDHDKLLTKHETRIAVLEKEITHKGEK